MYVLSSWFIWLSSCLVICAFFAMCLTTRFIYIMLRCIAVAFIRITGNKFKFIFIKFPLRNTITNAYDTIKEGVQLMTKINIKRMEKKYYY